MYAIHSQRLVPPLLLLLFAITVGSALAHEHRQVGPYEVVVGWRVEPALAEQPNGLDLRVSRQDESPVEGLEETLQAEVIFGDRSMPLELRARRDEPGAYTSDVIPTREGSYLFHIFGTIEGMEVDERFDSADGEFSDINPVSTIQFPEPVRPASEMQGALVAAQAELDTTRLIAMAGLVAGLTGLVLGGLALGRR